MTYKTVILGAGESGLGAALLAKAKGEDPFVSDINIIEEDKKDELAAYRIPFEEGGHSEKIILDAQQIIKSPGIPEDAAIIKKAVENEIIIVDELEFAYRYTKAKMIAITGTNGKTTTTLLVHHILKEAGLKIGLAGNVGHSLARQVIEDKYDFYAVEISSFQLDGMSDFRAHIAVLLNITPDHLDRYNNDFQQYVESKFRIIQNQGENDRFIYWEDDPSIAPRIAKESLNALCLPISIQHELSSGAYLSGNNLVFTADNDQFNVSTSALPFIGKHNFINSMAAILVAKSIGLTTNQILSGLDSFENAPHRLERVAVIRDVDYINDSKATNVNAVFYALEGIESPVIWIAGGIDKGNDYRLIDDLVRQKVKGLICLGVDNAPLISFFEGKVTTIHETQEMSEAIRIAHAMAISGDTVLLSPACASFDLFDNYEHRGDSFREEAIKLKLQNGHKKEAVL